MQQGAKKGLAAAKKLIQQGKFNEALEDLQVLSYKFSKVFQIYLLIGFCCQKLHKSKQAEKAYLQVLDLHPSDPNAMKQLCQIYTQRGDLANGTKYLEQMASICKKSDSKKYREAIVKLIDLYEKECNMQKIDPLFQEYSAAQETIGEDFVHIAKAYFKVGVTNQCFFLQKFQIMGMKGDQIRPVEPAAKQQLNKLMIEIVEYMKAVSLKYELSQKDIANSIMQLKMYFPQCASLLMMLLFDQYCVGQMNYSSYILGQLYHLCQAYFDNVHNYYQNLQYTSPENFAVCMLLAKEYLCFFKQFFTLQELLDQYYPRLASIQNQLEGVFIREEYRKKIDKFILKECREMNESSKRQNIELQLNRMRERIESLENSYLEEIIAKIALHSFTNYDQLNDMKYKLKVRIKQLEADTSSPHLYKYYYDYVMKMARIYKTLDQQIPIRDVLTYITTHDPSDCKYQLELIWFNFCMQAKSLEAQRRKKVAIETIKLINNIQGKLQFSQKSGALRKIMILKIFGGDSDIKEDINLSLQHQRSFENLQCAAFFYFRQKMYKQSLILLREAYKLSQNHYHINRLFFLALYKCDQTKEALAFLEHLHSTFTGVFWVNYFLGIDKINQKKFMEAESFVVRSLEAFQAGAKDNFKFFYEKVFDIGEFSMLHLVKQNQYSIFFDEIMLPEEFIYQQLPLLSNLYFERQVEKSRIKLLLKEGELLKILGRTKSALNYLEDAYNQSLKLQVGAESDSKQLLDHVLVRKQYATLLFYSCQLRQAEEMLQSAHFYIKLMLQSEPSTFVLKIDDQIKALFFQISISRLSVMMKFQSQECISDYLSKFREGIQVPKTPSLTFLKNKYQFHIFQFMHQRKDEGKVQLSIAQFLKYFNLDFNARTSESFAIRLQQLNQTQRKFVRECIEDYYIVKGLCRPPSSDELLHILSLFPRSSTLCVLFGSVSSDIKLKTASFLKVIQLDRESSISMDILASLYLKQKNYLAAAKLFLKSLQTDVLNPKCYLGLSICLFCLIVRAVEEEEKEQIEIVEQCLMRINSYMEFIRQNDPFENYHLLSFLKLILSDGSSQFQNKLILQSAHKNCLRYRDTLLGELLQVASNHWKELNFWKSEQQFRIVESYISSSLKQACNSHSETAYALAKRVKQMSQELGKVIGTVGKEIGLKTMSKLLSELGMSICLALKSNLRQAPLFEEFIQACLSWENSFKLWFDQSELLELKQQLKGYLYSYIFLGEWETSMIRKVDYLFSGVSNFDHLIIHYKKIPKFQRQIARQLLLNPSNEQIRQIIYGYQIALRGWNLRKAKLTHRLQLQNANNLNTTDETHTYKQLSILYRDPQSILLYISSQWSNDDLRNEQSVSRWVKLIEYLLRKKQSKQDQAFFNKVRRMKIEMLSYLTVKFGSQMAIQIDEYQQEKIKKLSIVFRIMDLINKNENVESQLKSLGKIFKGSSDEFDWWAIMNLISYIAKRVKTSSRFELLLTNLQDIVEGKLKAYAMLLRFIISIGKNPNDEDTLIQQIVELTNLASSCQGIVSPTAEVILECSKCHSAGTWEDMEAELARAAENIRIASYSDQILINFFQLLKQYKITQANPNGEGVVESFLYLANNMYQMIKEPLLRGFVLSLRGMVMSLSQGENRSIKMAMLLSPSAAKGLFSSGQ